MPLPTEYDYVDYADAAGLIKRLPVAKGTSCGQRPAPSALTTNQINSLVDALPAPPPGYSWRKKNCIVGDGPWVIDTDNPPSFIPDPENTAPIALDDKAGQTPLGIVTVNL